MRLTLPPAAGFLALIACGALAQDAPQPPALELPAGARVRLRTQASPGDWIKGTLASADSREHRARSRGRTAARRQRSCGSPARA